MMLNTIRTASRRLVSGLLPAMAVLATVGCKSDQTTGLGAAADGAIPTYFVANSWVDADNSGGADYWEFDGANKWTFRSDESITFVSRLDAPVGTSVTWQLKSPEGEIVDQKETVQRWKSTWRRAYTGPVADLIDMGGTGVWWVEWYINGERIGECAANLIE